MRPLHGPYGINRAPDGFPGFPGFPEEPQAKRLPGVENGHTHEIGDIVDVSPAGELVENGFRGEVTDLLEDGNIAVENKYGYTYGVDPAFVKPASGVAPDNEQEENR
jgi:hypothetical protein